MYWWRGFLTDSNLKFTQYINTFGISGHVSPFVPPPKKKEEEEEGNAHKKKTTKQINHNLQNKIHIKLNIATWKENICPIGLANNNRFWYQNCFPILICYRKIANLIREMEPKSIPFSWSRDLRSMKEELERRGLSGDIVNMLPVDDMTSIMAEYLQFPI